MGHIYFENIPVVIRKGQKEEHEKWVNLVGLNRIKSLEWFSICRQGHFLPIQDGGESLTLNLLPFRILYRIISPSQCETECIPSPLVPTPSRIDLREAELSTLYIK
jgi:hypothetical protein